MPSRAPQLVQTSEEWDQLSKPEQYACFRRGVTRGTAMHMQSLMKRLYFSAVADRAERRTKPRRRTRAA